MDAVEKILVSAEAHVLEMGLPAVSLILAAGLFLIIVSVAVLLYQSRRTGGATHSAVPEIAPGERHVSVSRKTKGDVFEQRISEMARK